MGVTELAAVSTSAVSARTSQELSNVFLKQSKEAAEGVVELIKDSTARTARASQGSLDVVV